MRTVFFGSPAAALPSLEALLAAGHTVELVVTQPDKPAGRGRRLTPSPVKALAVDKGLPVIEPARIRTDEPALERIRAAAPDVNVVVAYGQIIPRSIHWLPRHHSLNVHFSLLPKYRGAAPVQWTILNGDAESGVTIIELNDRMDEGDILAREHVSVGPDETAAELETRLARLGAGLLVRTLEAIDRLPRTPQDHRQATLAPKVQKEDGRLDWTKPAGAIERRVLALGEKPGAFTFFKGRRINVLKGAQALCKYEEGSARPGEVWETHKTGLAVACGGCTVYLIETLQPEGKAPMSAYAFSLGAKISPGDILGI